MSADSQKPPGISITSRTALWSWVVTLVTLLIFATAIIPQQKRTLKENLESKARGSAVSLRDVAAGAVVNEDFSSVVDHCKEMLKGDPTLEYLVITKSDGFSLINERSGWRVEPKAGEEWRPGKRVENFGIGTTPMFKRRVFYYSLPFDYSGIQWGWIHVGLSLESYDRSVASVYRSTAVVAVGCILLSLVASGFYARRLVRPILSLRNVVQRVAGGDLAARADLDRGDELGTLARSVNQMTEALLRRDRILESVRFAAKQFLGTSDWNAAIPGVLGKIGHAAGVCRASVWENEREGEGELAAVQRHEWAAGPVAQESRPPGSQKLRYEADGFAGWVRVLGGGGLVANLVAAMPAGEAGPLTLQGVRSLIVIPIHVEGAWWGFLRFEDCVQDRLWSESERDSLRAAADMLGAAIARQRAQDALLEAKETLEERVKERTQELQEQVRAKDRAHADLAQAQHQLVDASRQAGMAEVATGVLHNVGNVLNSVNVSVNVINDHLKRSQTPTLKRISSLLEANRANVGNFLATDPKGRRLPELLSHLAAALEEERNHLLNETQTLVGNVEHIKEIVAMQQSYAKVAGMIEDLPVRNLVEDALRLNAGAFLREAVRVKLDLEAVPPVRVDKHKVLQILVNLFRNARQALKASDRVDKLLVLGVSRNERGGVNVTVRDNGVGIEAGNLTRIFAHGFTTKKDGHGFGLHSGALAAREMGGSLQALSDGPGEGATFILELPVAPEAPAANNTVNYEPRT